MKRTTCIAHWFSHLGILWIQLTTRSSRVDVVASKEAQDGCQKAGVVEEHNLQQRDAQPIRQVCSFVVPKSQTLPEKWSHSLPGSCSWWSRGSLLGDGACPPVRTGREYHIHVAD